jgi:beta-N-acetylhexosaminidase
MQGPVVVDIGGTVLTAAERQMLRHPLVGMVILFSRNYESAEQLAALTADIHALRDPPLLIAVDHEGGRVQRFRRPPFTHLPAMARLGELWDRDVLLACRTAVSAGYVMASELRACGVDLTFAPVLDVDWGRSEVIGDRAFHADARTAAMLATQLCHGMALAGMANCGKHFPGHGWAEADSHHAVPTDPRPLAELLVDAAPYGWLGPVLAGVMPAHVVYPEVDTLPAGFSRRWIQDILRGQLGFAGAVFSDDLSMAGARVAGDVPRSAQAAINAGCDFVLVCNDPPAAAQVLSTLRWRSGGLFVQRAGRLSPHGQPPSWASLRDSELYGLAQRDVAAWMRQIGEGAFGRERAA